MYKFPKDLFTDVRVEDEFATSIVYEDSKLQDNKIKKEKGAFIRIFDGKRWYYSSTIYVDNIQEAIDDLAKMATPNDKILEHPIVKKMEVNKDIVLRYTGDRCVKNIDNSDKQKVVEDICSIYERNEINKFSVVYKEQYKHKHIVSSLGTDVEFDFQTTRVMADYSVVTKDYPYELYCLKDGYVYQDMLDLREMFINRLEEDIDYANKAVPVESGQYTCVLAPKVVGVFAHESFGHQSEADLIIGDETREKMFTIGNKIGAEVLNIVDSGCVDGTGQILYDDEGNRCTKTYLIKEGHIAGHMHTSVTASSMKESVSGNARAKSFEYEPIPRMTTTYVEPGNETTQELFSKVKDGIFIESMLHGSGMQVFTIAPLRAFRIRDGKISDPVKVSVISGEVKKALMDIDGLSNKVELGAGNCGKMEQFPLTVGMGGPYMRVHNITVS